MAKTVFEFYPKTKILLSVEQKQNIPVFFLFVFHAMAYSILINQTNQVTSSSEMSNFPNLPNSV